MRRTQSRLALPLVLVLALAAIVAACGGSAAQPAGSGAPAALPAEVGVDEAAKIRDAGGVIVDVREPSEWAEGYIEGAVLISLGDLAGRAGELPKDKQIVVVCRSGNRSKEGRDILLSAGLTSVTSMAGGVRDWAASGRPLVTGQ